jgi:hypothetical protein
MKVNHFYKIYFDEIKVNCDVPEQNKAYNTNEI